MGWSRVRASSYGSCTALLSDGATGSQVTRSMDPSPTLTGMLSTKSCREQEAADGRPGRERVTPTLRAIVIDQEREARQRLASALRYLDVTVCGEAGDVAAGLALIDAVHPDVVFTEVGLPDSNGFELARVLKDRPSAVRVFVTANAEHAVQAFEVAAADFLLKPFSTGRLRETLDRIAHSRPAMLRERDKSSFSRPSPREALWREAATRFWVSSQTGVRRILVADIVWIEAERDYVKFHMIKGKTFLKREPLHLVENVLPAGQFIRVHRSKLGRTACVERFGRRNGSQCFVELGTGEQIDVSRKAAAAVRASILGIASSS